MTTISPFSRPFYMMAKPAGSTCNLACTYCYYLEKSELYDRLPHVMSDEVLERFISEYIACQPATEILFTWHGGEPLVRPLSFYQRVIRLQRKYAAGKHIDNAIQTNGTLLNDEWCRFFRDNGWLVGVSIDGPEPLHNAYRTTRGGVGTFHEVMAGIERLNRHRVEWNALACVNHLTAAEPLAVYHFFRDTGCRYIQFTPVVERLLRHDGRTPADDHRQRLLAADETAGAELAPFSVTPTAWGQFLCTVFDEWVKRDVAEIYVNVFDATLANWLGVTPGMCSLSHLCGHVGSVEWNGDIYPCDHFTFAHHRLGNLMQQPLYSLMNGARQQAFARQKTDGLPRQCRDCEFLFACHGECPRNRFATSTDGTPGLNYLCEGYRQFFRHMAPAMTFMADEYRAGRPPANVMKRNVNYKL